MKAIFFTIILALSLGGGGTFLWLYYGGFKSENVEVVAFINVYGDYAEVAEKVEFLVHLPSTEGNTDRAELLVLLNSILTDSIEPERRDDLARLAYANLSSIKKEIDSAQVTQVALYELLQDLDNIAKTFPSIELQNRAGNIVLLARKRAEFSARAISILSEINDHTYAIITRILAEKGVLSQEHILEINRATNDAEKRFKNLEDLYSELSIITITIDKAFAEFVEVAI